MFKLTHRNLEMRYFIAFAIVLCSCTSNDDRSIQKQVVIRKDTAKAQTYYSKEIGSNASVVNTADRKIMVLYNSVDGFLLTSDSHAVHLSTECMDCELEKCFRSCCSCAGTNEVAGFHMTYRVKII